MSALFVFCLEVSRGTDLVETLCYFSPSNLHLGCSWNFVYKSWAVPVDRVGEHVLFSNPAAPKGDGPHRQTRVFDN